MRYERSIGIQSFERIREEGYVYIDKTALLYKLTDSGSIYFLGRSRRFGKIFLVNALERYFAPLLWMFSILGISLLFCDTSRLN